MLSFIVFLPLLFAVLLLFIPENKKNIFQWLTFAVLSVELGALGYLYANFDAKNTENLMQFVEKTTWIYLQSDFFGGGFHIQYFVGIDKMALTMLLTAGIVLWVGALSSFSITKNPKAYFSLYLLLSSTVFGCFVALDFFLFYVFFEFMLLPMFFLIGIWGGERREYASFKFLLYTLGGSLFILGAMIVLCLSTIDIPKTAQANNTSEKIVLENLAKNDLKNLKKIYNFDVLLMQNPQNYLKDASIYPNDTKDFYTNSQNTKNTEKNPYRYWVFWALLLGFLVKLPVVPLHTWLPDAHVEAPTPISVVLAGILLKIGGYGIIRFVLGIFPDVFLSQADIIAGIGVISIIYGAMNAIAMQDLKKMIAYSSISHLGFVLLGISSLTSVGINGAVFQMASHGVLSAMLFVLVGVLYDRTHDRNIKHYEGLWTKMPVYSVWVMIGFFASLGLPLFSGFVGELLCLLGAFQSQHIHKIWGILGLFGIVLGAGYFLWALQRMFLGKFWVFEKEKNENLLTDTTLRENIILAILAFLTLLLGIYPNVIL